MKLKVAHVDSLVEGEHHYFLEVFGIQCLLKGWLGHIS